MFINSSQELSPNEVDDVVDMKLGESMEDSVKRAVEGCVSLMGLEMPLDEQIQDALDLVKGYTPAVKKPDDVKKKKLDIRYFGLLPEIDLEDLLDRILTNEHPETKNFWTQLKTNNRVAKRPHVTIVHRNSIDAERELWDRCVVIHEMAASTPPLFKIKLTNVVWNGRVMAITVEDFDAGAGGDEGQEGHEFVSKLSYDVRKSLHITVGTQDERTLPVEAKTMVQAWGNNRREDTVKSVRLDDLVVYGRIRGLTV